MQSKRVARFLQCAHQQVCRLQVAVDEMCLGVQRLQHVQALDGDAAHRVRRQRALKMRATGPLRKPARPFAARSERVWFARTHRGAAQADRLQRVSQQLADHDVHLGVAPGRRRQRLRQDPGQPKEARRLAVVRVVPVLVIVDHLLTSVELHRHASRQLPVAVGARRSAGPSGAHKPAPSFAYPSVRSPANTSALQSASLESEERVLNLKRP